MKHIEDKIALGSIRTYYILLLDFIENLDLKTNSYNSNYICGTLWNFVDSLWNQFARVISFYNPKTEKIPQSEEISENVLPFAFFFCSLAYISNSNIATKGGCCGIISPGPPLMIATQNNDANVKYQF